MADGPGKYDDEAMRVMTAVNADGVVLLVFNGSRGHGMAVKATWEASCAMVAMLRSAADQMERDLERGPIAPGRHVTIAPKGRG